MVALTPDLLFRVVAVIIVIVILDRLIQRKHKALVKKVVMGRLLSHRLIRMVVHIGGLALILWMIDIIPIWNELQTAYPNGSRIVTALIIWTGAFYIDRNMSKIFEEVRSSTKIKNKEINVLTQKIVNYIILTSALIITLNIFGLVGAIEGLLVGAGFAGIVIGFAAQETIGNIFAGITLILDRPFKIGDWIHLKNSNLVGEVIEISLRSTTINAPDNTPINLPNSLVAREPIVNYTAHRLRRFFIPIGISYESDVPKAVKIIKQTLEKDPATAKEGVKGEGYFAPIEVVVEKLGDSSVDMTAKVFVDTLKNGGIFETKGRMIDNIKKNLKKAKIEIPYPRRYLIYDRDQKKKRKNK